MEGFQKALTVKVTVYMLASYFVWFWALCFLYTPFGRVFQARAVSSRRRQDPGP